MILTSRTKPNPLAALKENKCVILSITDKKMRLKKKNKEPVLMIAPVSIFGAEEKDMYLFSIPNYGCELMNIHELKTSRFFMLGLTMNAAKILINELNKVFKQTTQEI